MKNILIVLLFLPLLGCSDHFEQANENCTNGQFSDAHEHYIQALGSIEPERIKEVKHQFARCLFKNNEYRNKYLNSKFEYYKLNVSYAPLALYEELESYKGLTQNDYLNIAKLYLSSKDTKQKAAKWLQKITMYDNVQFDGLVDALVFINLLTDAGEIDKAVAVYSSLPKGQDYRDVELGIAEYYVSKSKFNTARPLIEAVLNTAIRLGSSSDEVLKIYVHKSTSMKSTIGELEYFAAIHNDSVLYNALGLLNETFMDGDLAESQALKYYELAAATSNSKAKYNLATYILDGFAPKLSEQDALNYLTASKRQEAEFYLALNQLQIEDKDNFMKVANKISHNMRNELAINLAFYTASKASFPKLEDKKQLAECKTKLLALANNNYRPALASLVHLFLNFSIFEFEEAEIKKIILSLDHQTKKYATPEYSRHSSLYKMERRKRMKSKVISGIRKQYNG